MNCRSLINEATQESRARFLLPGMSGMLKEVRDRTIVMAVEIYADESGGRGAGRYLSIAGLVAEQSRWDGFAEDWRRALKSSSLPEPFHMVEFVEKFKLWDVASRNKLLEPLADVINARARSSIHISLDVEAFDGLIQPVRPYLPKLYPSWVAGVLRLVWSATNFLWQNGHRERFRIVFDEKKPHQFWAQELYANVREILDYHYPFQSSIMPNQLDFETDENVPQLQAADLYAWCLRYSGKDGIRDADHPYNDVLRGHLQSVTRAPTSEYVKAEDIYPLVRTAEILAGYRNGARDASLIKEPLFGDFS